jgi:ribokinase
MAYGKKAMAGCLAQIAIFFLPQSFSNHSGVVMKKPVICVAGSANMDLVTTVQRMPMAGETIHGNAFQTYFGGKGANQAVMAAKLGGEVWMIAKIGEDTFGKDYMKNFTACGLNTSCVYTTKEASTGIAAITVQENGQNAIIVVGGANLSFSEEEIEKAAAAIGKADVLVCQNEINLNATLRFLQIARMYGVPTIFNPAPAEDFPDEIYRLCDYFCPNESEAAHIVGFPVKTIEDVKRAGKDFLSRGVKNVIITLGSKGSLLMSEGKTVLVETEKVTAVDTTGAGDAFIGTVAYFIASGIPVEEAMKKASHAAALSVQKRGAQKSFPNYAECGF